MTRFKLLLIAVFILTNMGGCALDNLFIEEQSKDIRPFYENPDKGGYI